MWRRTDKPVRRRPVLGIICLVLTAYFLLPLCIGILHIGMIWPTALLLLAASVCFWPRWPERLPRWLQKTAAGVIAVGLSLVAAVLALMILAAAHRAGPSTDAPRTVIVLGCEVHPDNRPSLMLQDRINAACDYLTAHPEAVCVASGGMDDDERITEARCIRDTLVGMGIAPERIYLEESSGSTRENLAFSAGVIAENGLDTRVAICTDNFHQYRAGYFAKMEGLEPLSVGNPSFWVVGPGYWAREVVGVLAAWIRGY